ncbi:endonuclease/exonuclease/phosphatase family protein [Nocardioides sp.]|uniref:endonuclease/exonuclease/phosphatase family protein n=1 Tax=Nocardioides sp. TaxID=35761 RepID=UPI00356450AE
MRHSIRTWPARTAAAAAGFGLVLAAAAGPPVQARPDKPDVPTTVMTRNIYVGADIQRPLRATTGKTGLDALVALGNANTETRAIVDGTNFPRRSKLLAAEIAAAGPDLVGLQEVALWRSGPLELPPPLGTTPLGTTNAQRVDLDYLQLLLQDLRRQGTPYQAVVVQNRMDLETPSFLGDPRLGTLSQGRDIRLTVRDVILLRASSRLRVLAKGGAQFDAQLRVDVAGTTLDIVRGYGWVDVAHGSGTAFRLVNTHLEAASSSVALQQAQELVVETTRQDRSTVIVCDCNSDPLDNSTRPPDPTPHSAAYRLLTGLGGFTDMWLEWRPAGQGLTFGLGERVNDPAPRDWTIRIDMILARPGPGHQLAVVAGEVTGADPTAKDPLTGLWPSDHAGVVLTITGARG